MIHLDQLSFSYLVILALLLLVILAGILFQIGLITWAVASFANFVRYGIKQGFQLWQVLFAWAAWPTFLAMLISSLFVGWVASSRLPYLTIVCALIPLFMGVTACLAYMLIDLERYAVARGYKSVHNPLKGQELAVNLVRYGQAVGVPLLVSASVGMVGGFALLNFGLYLTMGHSWYVVKEDQPATYVDFVANALIVLLRIVDVLDFARASHLLETSYVRQAKWPATTLLTVFRMFFTLVLLQQVFASFRQGQVLSETITDLWNPNEPIHERACNALPQYGPGAVGPLLISLGNVTSLTKEQRERLPLTLAAIGPAAIPSLVSHLHDANEHVRAIAVSALGHLRIRGTIVLLVTLKQDSSDIVRQSLIEALGFIASTNSGRPETKLAVVSPRFRVWRSIQRGTSSAQIAFVEPVELAVTTLQDALTDPALSVRAHAARALGRIGPAASVAAAGLILLLKDEDETVRRDAIEAVGKVGGATAEIVAALVECLDDPSHHLRAAAAKELGAMKEAAVAACPALVPLLQDREEEVRDAAAEAIGQIGHFGNEAADEMAEGLASLDSVVRAQTAEALGTIGESAHETAPALVDALTDENDMVRAKAVEALGKIGEAAADVAIPGLVRALRDSDNVVSSLAAEALGQMGESADMAIPSLIRSLQHINADVRGCAAESLGKLGADAVSAQVALERACIDEDAGVRSKAICALSMIDKPSKSTRQIVLAGLEDTDAEVRTAALNAIFEWSDHDESSLNSLFPLLEDPNEDVRIEVTKVLPRLAGATANVIDGLCIRLRDDTDLVQAQAAQSLGELGTAAAAAGKQLFVAAQTGEATVRARAIQAIRLIRPSETMATSQMDDDEREMLDAIREIETQPQFEEAEIPVGVIPIIVTPVVDPASGQEVDLQLTLELVASSNVEAAAQVEIEKSDAERLDP